MFGNLFFIANDDFSSQEADIFHTNKNYSPENQFSVKTILTETLSHLFYISTVSRNWR